MLKDQPCMTHLVGVLICFGIVVGCNLKSLPRSPNPDPQECKVTDGQLKTQDNWRWDNKSQNLIFAGNPAISPAGGKPDFRGSANYVLYYVPEGCAYTGKGQDNWRWDNKSQNLIFAGNPAISPAGGKPDFRGSANYVLYMERYGRVPVKIGKYQTGWKWDKKSQHLIYSKNKGAISAAGGEPDFTGSGDYVLEYKE